MSRRSQRSRRKNIAAQPAHIRSTNSAIESRCANCNATLAGVWCSTCGQKSTRLDPTWHDLLHDGIHEFIHLDGKIVRTVRTLFLQPGKLTVEFLNGRRASYIGPLRLYLTLSATFFLLSAVVPNPNPDRLVSPTTMEEAATEAYVADSLANILPKLMFILVPVFAMLLTLAYYSQRRHFPQYLYFSLHFHAAVFGMLALTVPLQTLPSERWLTIAQVSVIVGAFGYLVVGLRRVFDGRAGQAVLVASAVSLSYLVILSTLTLGVVLVLLRHAGIA